MTAVHGVVSVCVTVTGLMELQWLGVDYTGLLHAIHLCKAFKARLWSDSRHVARQLEGIGKQVFIKLPSTPSLLKLAAKHLLLWSPLRCSLVLAVLASGTCYSAQEELVPS